MGNVKHTNATVRRPARRGRPPQTMPVPAAILLAIGLFQTGAALAAMYKWVGRQGRGPLHGHGCRPTRSTKAAFRSARRGIPDQEGRSAIPPEQRKARERSRSGSRSGQRERPSQQTETSGAPTRRCSTRTRTGERTSSSPSPGRQERCRRRSVGAGLQRPADRRQGGAPPNEGPPPGRSKPAHPRTAERELASHRPAELGRQSTSLRRRTAAGGGSPPPLRRRQGALAGLQGREQATRPPSGQGVATAHQPGPGPGPDLPPSRRFQEISPEHRLACARGGRGPPSRSRAAERPARRFPAGLKIIPSPLRDDTGQPMAQLRLHHEPGGQRPCPKRVILKDISLRLYPAPRSRVLD